MLRLRDRQLLLQRTMWYRYWVIDDSGFHILHFVQHFSEHASTSRIRLGLTVIRGIHCVMHIMDLSKE